jgi:hypothetical protein
LPISRHRLPYRLVGALFVVERLIVDLSRSYLLD